MAIPHDAYWPILNVLSLHNHLIDNEEWDRLSAVFVDDIRLQTPAGEFIGISAVREHLREGASGDTHHTMNTIVDERGDGLAAVWSRFLVVTFEQTALTGDHVDEFVRTEAGWRIQHRRVTFRNRSDRAPDGSPWLAASFATWQTDPR